MAGAEQPFRESRRGEDIKPAEIDFKVEPGRKMDLGEKADYKVESDLAKQLAKMEEKRAEQEKMRAAEKEDRAREEAQMMAFMEELGKTGNPEEVASMILEPVDKNAGPTLEDEFALMKAENVEEPATATAKKPEDKGTQTAGMPIK